jgi:hypothetical protein
MADNPTPSIEIEELREAGEDGGDLMGYFARGHHDPYEFAKAANEHSGALESYDCRHVKPKYVSQVWYRTVQMRGEPKGTYEFRPATPGERGAWKATVCESVTDFSSKQQRMRQREYDRGWIDGMHHALCFLMNEIEYGCVIDSLETLDKRREIASRLRQSFSRAEVELMKESA